jgi:hypothetical protein
MCRLDLQLALLIVSLLVFEASLLAMAAEAQPAPVLIIREIGPGEVSLDGEWQFHLGDDVRWASPAYDDSQWEHVKADAPWGSQTHPSYTGFGWYRRHIEITLSLARKQKLAILMPPVDDAYEVFWNGKKIGNQGTVPPKAVWYIGHRQSFALPSTSSGPTDGLLAVRVWKAPLASFDFATGGGLNAPPTIGDAAVIAGTVADGDFQRLRGSLYGRALNFFFLLMAALCFFAWTRNREQKLFLWFALWLLAKVAQFYMVSDRVIGGVSAISYSDSLFVIYSMEDCSIFLLLLYLFNLQGDRRVHRWMGRDCREYLFCIDGGSRHLVLGA